MNSKKKFKINTKYKDFLITNVVEIDEINSCLIELEHIKTKAQVMHIFNNDVENLFCLGFQTLPLSSNGVPHILEHTVLCGSKKFPIKDPFFSMIRRSVNTFMNAFTGNDFTAYPASSEVEKDFYNLLEVYLDAVFYPKLRKESFLQEGWRLDIEKGKLVYKGIVFNEMKGALTSADDRLGIEMMKQLYPNLSYAHNYGGDPAEIPSLSYEEFLNFHKTHYHPSNCLFCFYGNIPLEKHIDFLEKNVFKNDFKPITLKKIGHQPLFKAPKYSTIYYPIQEKSHLGNKDIFSFGWMTCDIKEQETILALSLLDLILMGTDASILKLKLLSSKLCSDVYSYLNSEISQVSWSITCKGCKKNDQQKIYSIIETCLKKIIEEPIDTKIISACLHQLEFNRLEIKSSPYPYGLLLFFRAGLIKLHGCKPEEALKIHSLFKKLSEKLKNKNYLNDLIKKYLLNNPHRVNISVLPDIELIKKEKKIETEKLKKLEDSLSEKDKAQIIKQAQDLNKYQKEIESQSLSCLPKIDLTDLSHNVKDYPIVSSSTEKFTTHFHDCFTNGILYVDMVMPLPKITKEKDLYLLSLFTILFGQIDTDEHTYVEILEMIQLYLGDVETYISLNPNYSDANDCSATFSIHIKSLYKNTKHLFNILFELLTKTNFQKNKKRIKELILQTYTYLEQNLDNNAIDYANLLSQNNFSLYGYLSNKLHGLDFYKFIKDLMENIDTKIDDLITDLDKLKQKILLNKPLDLVICCDKSHFDKINENNYYSLNNISITKEAPKWENNFPIEKVNSQGRVISSSVAFTSLSIPSITYDHKDASCLLIASKLFNNVHLHKAIREQGGAYGSGSSICFKASSFYFFGYRDPNLSTTLEAFLKAIDLIIEKKFTDQNLIEAKIGIIRNMDMPVSLESRASISYFYNKSGKTKDKRLKLKEEIFKKTKEEIAQAVKIHIYDNLNKAILVSFANENLLLKENKILSEKDKIKLKEIISC